MCLQCLAIVKKENTKGQTLHKTVQAICLKSGVVLQLKHAPDFLKVKVDASTYKGSGGIEPSEDRSKKQDQATQAYAKVGRHCLH